MTIKEIIENYVISRKSPGISVGLINENETQTFNYGEIKKGSGISPTSDTVYEIGSVTKPFTAILGAQLQHEGLLALDDPIVKYLPQLESNSEIVNKKITIRHVITHTADLPTALPLKKILPYMVKLYLKIKHIYNPYSDYSRDELYSYLNKRKIKKTPGTTWSYSNYGYAILGHIYENITGSSYEELIKNKICTSLEMKDTGINLFDSHKDRMVTGYTFSGNEANFWSSPSMEGMISIRSTITDLLKFAKANLGLSQTKLSPILEYCLSTKVNPRLTTFMKYYPKYMYGLPLSRFRIGWFVFDLENHELVGIDGATEGCSSFFIMNLENKTCAVILTNRQNPRHVHRLGITLLKEMGENHNGG